MSADDPFGIPDFLRVANRVPISPLRRVELRAQHERSRRDAGRSVAPKKMRGDLAAIEAANEAQRSGKIGKAPPQKPRTT